MSGIWEICLWRMAEGTLITLQYKLTTCAHACLTSRVRPWCIFVFSANSIQDTLHSAASWMSRGCRLLAVTLLTCCLQCFPQKMWPDSWNDPPAEQGCPWIMPAGNSNRLKDGKKKGISERPFRQAAKETRKSKKKADNLSTAWLTRHCGATCVCVCVWR